MINLAKSLGSLKPIKAMVLGDLLLDTYTFGKARRISPEAPVAIVHVQEEKHLPGGSGNVVLNLISLGADLCVIGRVGNDWAGGFLRESFLQEGVALQLIVAQEKYKTPIKNRVIADNQQIVRVDIEQIVGLSEPLEQQIIDALPSLMEGIQIIALSDYGKGFLTPTLLQAVIQEAKKRNIPVITDPKGQDFIKYAGTTLIKPNLSEAYAAANLPLSKPLEQVADTILKMTQAQLLMITRSEEGITLFEAGGKRHDFPVQAKKVKDVTGAGDTVLAMLTMALANGLSYAEACQLCNVAASLAIEQVGCARITLSDMAHHLLLKNQRHKVFLHEDLLVLKEVVKKQPFNLLILPYIDQLSIPLFEVIKKMSAQSEVLLIYINDANFSEIMLEMLASLKEVGFILTHPYHLKWITEQAKPAQVCTYDAAWSMHS